MNVATISGNLGKEIELRYTPSGKAVAKGSLAVKGSYKDSSGEYPTNWINFIAWGKVAEILTNFTKKGDKLVLSGEIITGSYEKDGKKVYTTEININSFDLPPKSSGASNESAYTPVTEDEEDPDGLPF
ncbi:MAG TPA: single-stranded DNA-binding protein [Paenisporosarcina sp.]|nr:single-stranded DNA-binding protein [Paenisporosarcina sp.]